MEKKNINWSEPAELRAPIKLLLAKDFMTAHITGSVYAGFPYNSEEVAKEALKDAEALLNAYNNQ